MGGVKEWVWCMCCERVFEVELSRAPKILTLDEQDRQQEYSEGCFAFVASFEAQFGRIDDDGKIYAECPYDDCEGLLPDFKWWRCFRIEQHPEYPERPYRGFTYPLYPEQEKAPNKPLH